MNYKVDWSPLAVEELAAMWLAATDKTGVSKASHNLELKLGTAPFLVGVPYGSSVRRLVLDSPIGMGFDIVEDDKKVIVQSCWLIS